MSDLQELELAKAVIESFAPPKRVVVTDKPYRIGFRQVPVWVIPVIYITNEQVIAVRLR